MPLLEYEMSFPKEVWVEFPATNFTNFVLVNSISHMLSPHPLAVFFTATLPRKRERGITQNWVYAGGVAPCIHPILAPFTARACLSGAQRALVEGKGG